MTPPKGSKVKNFNVAITKAIVNNFAEILHAGRAAIDMKHINRNFSLKTWVRVRWVDLGGGAEAKIKLFSEYGHVTYQIKADDAGSNMVANILPTDTPLTQGVGSKGQTIYFSESSHVGYQIKADDAGSNMVTIFCTQTHPRPRGWGQKVKLYLFSERSHVAYQIKGN